MSYLETLVTRFYEKHDAGKLGDVSHVTGIVTWTKNNGSEALDFKLKTKYKETLRDLERPGDPPLDSDWKNIYKALEKFYSKHEPNKPDDQIVEIYKWTMQKGVFALNEKLTKKYGEALPKKALESWKSRWAPVVEETKSATYGELLTAFFQIHDPAKPKADIEFLANYATRHGLEPVNEQLRLNFGVGLEDVENIASVVPGPSSLKNALASVGKMTVDPSSSVARRDQLSAQLKDFYAKHDPTKLQPANKEGFDKIVEYGMNKGLRKLNGALRDKYNEDLDSARRDTIRQSVRDFLSTNDPTAVGQTEIDVNFALENGLAALDQKFKNEYGDRKSVV